MAIVCLVAPSRRAEANDPLQILNAIVGGNLDAIERNRGQVESAPRRPSASQPRSVSEARQFEPRLTADQVFVIQTRLSELGHAADAPDGGLGENSRDAIRRFQASVGAPATGYLTLDQARTLQGGRTAAEIVGSNPKVLTPSEMMAFQKALKAQRYPIVSTDGIAGPATGRAIAKFLADRGVDPYPLSLRDAYRLATGDRGERGALAAAGERADVVGDGSRKPPDPSLYRKVGKTAGFDVDRELARRALHANPALADRQHVVEAWLREDSRGAAAKSEIARLYEEGGEFERKDAIKAFREKIAAEAIGGELKLAFSIHARLIGPFEPGRGFPIAIGDSTRYSAKRHEIYNYRLGRRIALIFPDAPTLDRLPASDEATARRLSSTIRENRSALAIEMLVTVRRVGPEVDDPDGQGGLTGALIADATLDGLSIASGQTRLHGWDLSPAKTAAPDADGLAPADFAAAFGFNLLGGRLATGGDTSGQSGWKALVEMSSLGANPALLDDDRLALHFAALALTESEKIRLARGKTVFSSYGDALGSMDEFERRDLLARIRSDYAARIVARRPRMPFPIVQLLSAQLGDYDFAKRQFTLNLFEKARETPKGQLASAIGTALADGRAEVDHGLGGFPTTLTLAPEKAKDLLDDLKSKRRERRVYIALFAELSASPVARSSAGAYAATPTRIALYADPQLTDHIVDYEIADFAVKPSPPPSPEAASVRNLLALPLTPEHDLARAAEQFGPARGFLEAYLQSASRRRQANEFQRDDILASLRAAVVKGGEPPETVWLHGAITVGAYDHDKAAFAVEQIALGAGASAIDRFAANIRHNIHNAGDLRMIAVDREVARKATEETGRVFEIRARTKPVGAVRRDGAYPEVIIEQHVLELYLFTGQRGSDKDRSLLAKAIFNPPTIVGPANPTVAGALPARPMLSQDLLVSVVAKDRIDRTSERSLHWLIANRFLNDTVATTSLPARFFRPEDAAPKLATVETSIAPFRAWSGQLPYALPRQLTLAWNRSEASHVATAPEIAQTRCHELSTRADHAFFAPGMNLPPLNEMFQRQVNGHQAGTASEPATLEPVYLGFPEPSALECVGSALARTIMEQLTGGPHSWWPRVVVAVDRLPSPPRGALGDLAEIDVETGDLELIENGSDLPHIMLRTIFQRVRFYDRQSSATPTLLRTFERHETEATDLPQQVGGEPEVLGVRLGQSFEEAEAQLKRHMPDAHVLDAEQRSGDARRPFQHARMFLRRDGLEYVALLYEPDGDKKSVLAVVRNVLGPESSFPADAVMASLRKKYGPEQLRQAKDAGNFLVWGKRVRRPRVEGRPDQPSECAVGLYSAAFPRGWTAAGETVPNVAALMPWERVRGAGFIDWPILASADGAAYARCGGYLEAYQGRGSTPGLRMLLIDIPNYLKAFADSSDRAAKQFDGTMPPSSGVEVKL